MDREELAKAWLIRLVEHTALSDVADLSMSWVASQAPPLIADVLASVSGPAGDQPPELDDERRERYSHVTWLRSGPGAAELIPRDLAALQSLLIEALGREAAGRGEGELAGALGRLAEVFGAIQAEVGRALLAERATPAGRDELTGLPGAAQLDDWIRALLAEQRRYRHPFALALIDIEGLDQVNDAYGREAGDGMLATVAGVISRQVRVADRAFRIEQDELCVVAPHQEPEGLLPMAERLTGLLASSQLPEGPRLAITVGVVGCPRDGDSPEGLLDAAQEATYAAKAAGRDVATASAAAPAAMQDR